MLTLKFSCNIMLSFSVKPKNWFKPVGEDLFNTKRGNLKTNLCTSIFQNCYQYS